MKGTRRVFVVAGIICLVLCLVLSGCGKKEKGKADESLLVTASPNPTPTPTPSEPPPVNTPEAPKTQLIGTVVDVTNGVNIRSGPSTESDVLFIAELGTQFKVLKAFYTSEWHKIEYEDGVAYVNANYLEITEVPVTDTAD